MNAKHIDRRDVLRRAAAGTAGAALYTLLGPSAAANDFAAPTPKLLLLFLRGGNDGLNAVLPAGSLARSRGVYSAYTGWRPGISIPASNSGATFKALPLVGPASAVDPFAELHPALQPLLAPYQQGKLAFLHRVGNLGNTLSHFSAQHLWEIGRPLVYGVPATAIYSNNYRGWVGRWAGWASATVGPFPAASVSVRQQEAFDSPLDVETQAHLRRLFPEQAQQRAYSFKEDPTAARALWESDLIAGLQGQASGTGGPPLRSTVDSRLRTLYGKTIDSEAQLEQLVSGAYTPYNNAQYPQANTTGPQTQPEHLPAAGYVTEFGNRLKDAAALLKLTNARVVGVELGGWDHHAGQVLQGNPAFGIHQQFLATLAHGLNALYVDLVTDPNAPDVLTLVMTEFGRTTSENPSLGTDHGTSGLMIALGHRVRAGSQMHNFGASPDPYYDFQPGNLIDFSTYLGQTSGLYMLPRTDQRTVFEEALVKHMQVPQGIVDATIFESYGLEKTFIPYPLPQHIKLFQQLNYLL